MPTPRSQRSYDHRLIRLVQQTGDATIATRIGVPRSTVAGWLRRSGPNVVTTAALSESAADDSRGVCGASLQCSVSCSPSCGYCNPT